MAKTKIINLREMEAVNPIANMAWWHGTRFGIWLIQNVLGRVTITVENFDKPETPVLYAMNHTHRYDFTQSRAALYNHLGVLTSTYVKYRAFQHRYEGGYMKLMGNIPMASRGYLISADFAAVTGRKLDEDEYRAIRNHIDKFEPLPQTAQMRALQEQSRDMLGCEFNADKTSYRDAILGCYLEAMTIMIGHSRQVVEAGHSLHIYPQGLFSTRLTPGRVGTVQIAAALDIPIVPMGFIGMNEAFEPSKIAAKGGPLRIRFGEPYRIKKPELAELRPFHPEDEARLRPILEQETSHLMDKINDLLDDTCCFGEGTGDDGLKGISRFFD